MVKLFVTENQLHERDWRTKIETTLTAFNSSLEAHKEDCVVVRTETKEQLTKLTDTITDNHEDWKRVVNEMDKANTARLRWANRFLITILLGLGGFIGSQAWSKIFHLLVAAFLVLFAPSAFAQSSSKCPAGKFLNAQGSPPNACATPSATDTTIYPHVANNAALSAIASTSYAVVIRDGFATPGDTWAVRYKSSNSACSIAAGAGDGGSQVPSLDSKCWIAQWEGQAPISAWGADATGVVNAATKVQAAVNALKGTNIQLWNDGHYLLGATKITVDGALEILGNGGNQTVYVTSCPASASSFLVTGYTDGLVFTGATGKAKGLCMQMASSASSVVLTANGTSLSGQKVVTTTNTTNAAVGQRCVDVTVAETATAPIAPTNIIASISAGVSITFTDNLAANVSNADTINCGGVAISAGATAGINQGHFEIADNTIIFPFDGIRIGGKTTGATQTNTNSAHDNNIISPTHQAIQHGLDSTGASTVGTILSHNQIVCFTNNTHATGMAFYDGATSVDEGDSGPYQCKNGTIVRPGFGQIFAAAFSGVLGDSSLTHDFWVSPTDATAFIYDLKQENSWTGATTSLDQSVLVENLVSAVMGEIKFVGHTFFANTNSASPLVKLNALGTKIIGSHLIAKDYTLGVGIELGANSTANSLIGNDIYQYNAGVLTTGIKVDSGANIFVITDNILIATTNPIDYTPAGETAIIKNNLGVDNVCPNITSATTISFTKAYSCFHLTGTTDIATISNSFWSERSAKLIIDSGLNFTIGGSSPGICGPNNINVQAGQQVTASYDNGHSCWAITGNALTKGIPVYETGAPAGAGNVATATGTTPGEVTWTGTTGSGSFVRATAPTFPTTITVNGYVNAGASAGTAAITGTTNQGVYSYMDSGGIGYLDSLVTGAAAASLKLRTYNNNTYTTDFQAGGGGDTIVNTATGSAVQLEVAGVSQTLVNTSVFETKQAVYPGNGSAMQGTNYLGGSTTCLSVSTLTCNGLFSVGGTIGATGYGNFGSAAATAALSGTSNLGVYAYMDGSGVGYFDSLVGSTNSSQMKLRVYNNSVYTTIFTGTGAGNVTVNAATGNAITLAVAGTDIVKTLAASFSATTDNVTTLGTTALRWSNVYATTYSAGAGNTAGVACSGAPTGAFASVGGIVTHC